MYQLKSNTSISVPAKYTAYMAQGLIDLRPFKFKFFPVRHMFCTVLKSAGPIFNENKNKQKMLNSNHNFWN